MESHYIDYINRFLTHVERQLNSYIIGYIENIYYFLIAYSFSSNVSHEIKTLLGVKVLIV